MPNDDDIFKSARDLRAGFKATLVPPTGSSVVRESEDLNRFTDEKADARALEAEMDKNRALRAAAGMVENEDRVRQGKGPRWDRRRKVATTLEDVEELTALRSQVSVFRDLTEPLAPPGKAPASSGRYHREAQVQPGFMEANTAHLVSKNGAPLAGEIQTGYTQPITSANSV